MKRFFIVLLLVVATQAEANVFNRGDVERLDAMLKRVHQFSVDLESKYDLEGITRLSAEAWEKKWMRFNLCNGQEFSDVTTLFSALSEIKELIELSTNMRITYDEELILESVHDRTFRFLQFVDFLQKSPSELAEHYGQGRYSTHTDDEKDGCSKENKQKIQEFAKEAAAVVKSMESRVTVKWEGDDE